MQYSLVGLSKVRQTFDLRLDAEYFQPKYSAIIEKIKSYKGGWSTLGKLGNFSNGNFIPERYYSESGKKFYIRIKELSLNAPLKKEKNDIH